MYFFCLFLSQRQASARSWLVIVWCAAKARICNAILLGMKLIFLGWMTKMYLTFCENHSLWMFLMLMWNDMGLHLDKDFCLQLIVPHSALSHVFQIHGNWIGSVNWVSHAVSDYVCVYVYNTHIWMCLYINGVLKCDWIKNVLFFVVWIMAGQQQALNMNVKWLAYFKFIFEHVSAIGI